jgi:hypothetical protein
MSKKRLTYFIDFDRTLSIRNSGDSVFKCGPPISNMITYVKQLLADGHKVVIFTARSGEPMLRPVRKFLEDNGLGKLDITNVKASRADFFIDDKAKEVEPNTGKFVVDELKIQLVIGASLMRSLKEDLLNKGGVRANDGNLIDGWIAQAESQLK